jgi:surfeit locus 1 family protein
MIVSSEKRAAPWRFWLTTLGALLTMATALRLGFWQLDRAAQKQSIASSQLRQAELPALGNADFDGLAPNARISAVHRTVRLEGRWLAQQTLYLDNRQMNAKPGFYALTPFVLAGGQGAVLVQRGWVPRDFRDRSRLQAIQTPDQPQVIEGRLALVPSRIYELGAPESGPIRQNANLADWSLPAGVAWRTPLTVVQTGPATEGLLREWPQVDAGVAKHHGYAFQWFALGGLVLVLYVWFQFWLPRRKRAALERVL